MDGMQPAYLVLSARSIPHPMYTEQPGPAHYEVLSKLLACQATRGLTAEY